MLRYFAIKVGDVATAAQMVGVVVELHLFVVVVRLEVAICSPCTCHSPCRLRRIVIAAEALTVHIVVIVFTIIRLVKRFVVVLDGLQLPVVLGLVVHRQAICSLPAYVFVLVCTVTCEVAS